MKIFFLLFLMIPCLSFAQTPQFSVIQLNKEGIELLKKQNFPAAEERFIQALGKNPFLAGLHLNLGLAFYGAQDMDKAEASYQTALKLAKNDTVKFLALFNLGELKGKQKKVDEALAFYQGALEIKPDSKETKTNIELLIQQQQQDQQNQKGKSDKDDQQKKKDDSKDNKDNKDGKGDKDKDKDKDSGPKQYEKTKPQPKPFKSEDLTQGDVNKILGELKQQEQKIRSEYNRRDVKEKPRDKDW